MAVKVDYLDFFKTVGKSKRLLRTGWVREKIKDPESVAAHSFRVGVLAMILADKLGVDKEKLIKMALIHNIGEAITGDIVWIRWGVVDLKAREKKEKEEIKHIVSLFSNIDEGEEYIRIFEEMTLMATREAKIFWQIDKLEMALQALEYEETQGKKLNEFFSTADLYIKEPFLRGIFDEILKERVSKERSFEKRESC